MISRVYLSFKDWVMLEPFSLNILTLSSIGPGNESILISHQIL